MAWDTAWSQLAWHQPWLWLIAAQPVLLAVWRRARRQRILHYADAHLHPWALRGALPVAQGRWRHAAGIAAWLLFAAAAAGPRIPLQLDPAQANAASLRERHAIDLMVVLDVSPSMRAQDVSPGRLERAKLKLLDLLPRLRGERLGLIAYSGASGILMPLGQDYDAFRHYLDLASPDLFETPGTALGAALDLARAALPPRAGHKAVLLVTDAEAGALSGTGGGQAMEAVKQMKSAGIPLFVLGIASKQGAIIPLPDGGRIEQDGVAVVSRMDEAGFADLARAAGGRFHAVEDGDGDWRALYDRGILALPGGKLPEEAVQSWRELFAWCLAPGLLLWLLARLPSITRGGAGAAGVLVLAGALAAGMLPAPAHAAVSETERDAHEAYRQRQFAAAQAYYARLRGHAARMGEGAAAYRRQDYLYAVRQFTAALLQADSDGQRAAALFNLGNSYYQAGNYGAAADAFQGALTLRPDHRDAGNNLALAAGKLAASRKPDPYSEEMMRRGRQTEGRQDEDTYEEPPEPELSKEKTGPELIRDEQQAAETARRRRPAQAGSGAAGGGQDGVAYRAALKKLEIVQDRPALLQKEVMKRDRANELPAGMAPW